MLTSPRRWLPAHLVAVSVFVFVALTACLPGRKLLELQVRHGSSTVLSTSFEAPDRQGGEQLWDRAGEAPFSTDTSLPPLPVDPADPLRAQIPGPIEVRILHAGRVETRATLTHLVVIRDAPTSRSWYLPPSEVSRVRALASP